MEPGGSMPNLQGFSNNPYPEPDQPSSSYTYFFRSNSLDPFYYCIVYGILAQK